MIFMDRDDAARKLAVALESYRGTKPLVLAIPRGAVTMGRIIADALEGDLDVILVRKLRAPGNPEFAVGAVSESGWTEIADYAAEAGADEAYLRSEIASQFEAIRDRRGQLLRVAAPIDPEGRVVIVVDDGLATGSTMVAALQSIRAARPARLVCAVPVAPPEALDKVSRLADDLVCLHQSKSFQAVGQFYRSFRQIGDSEVVECLRSVRGTTQPSA